MNRVSMEKNASYHLFCSESLSLSLVVLDIHQNNSKNTHQTLSKTVNMCYTLQLRQSNHVVWYWYCQHMRAIADSQLCTPLPFESNLVDSLSVPLQLRTAVNVALIRVEYGSGPSVRLQLKRAAKECRYSCS